MKRVTVITIVGGLICLSIGAPFITRNWSNILDMTMNGEDRVKRAYQLAGDQVRLLCEQAKIEYPPKRLHLRAFKSERQLELWAANEPEKPLTLIHTYRIAGMSGTLGPKRKEGDLQVPEGFYHIDRFNPQSRFRLSLGLNYPNASDRVRSDSQRPGSDIFIHGDRRSIGCLAMTDELIDQIYILCLQAKEQGQSKIPVHIFPFRMSVEKVKRGIEANPKHEELWKELEPAYRQFERTKVVPKVTVDMSGRYIVQTAK